MSWSVGGHEVPGPADLVHVDLARRQINSGVLVIGASAGDALAHIYKQTSNRGEKVVASKPFEASFDYLPLKLGDIRGFETHFHLYGLGDDERLQWMIEDFIPHARALIVAAPSISLNVRFAAQEVARLKRSLPVALLAPEETREQWTRLAGAKPVFEAAWSTDGVFPALKAAAKAVLTELRSADAPAPQPAPQPSAAPEKPWWKLW